MTDYDKRAREVVKRIAVPVAYEGRDPRVGVVADALRDAEERGARKFRAAVIDLLEPAMSDDHFNYCAWVAALPVNGIGDYTEQPKCEAEERHPGHAAPLAASPAQAERVSEEQLMRERDEARAALRAYHETSPDEPASWSQAVRDAVRLMVAEAVASAHSRIAARLRASADRREEAASRCSSTEFSQREASTHRSVAHALRSEADALEQGE